jgi:phage terminase large subunit-like protein
VFETNKLGEMAELCSRLYTAVVTQAVTHDGHPRLTAHMANAVVKERGPNAYITKGDRHSPRKTDLAIAAVLAYGLASQPKPQPVGCTNSAGHHKTSALQARPNLRTPHP